jgi:signal transduction histidine kinase
MRHIYTFLLILSFSFEAFGQQDLIDSLEHALMTEAGEDRISILNELGSKLFYSDTKKARAYCIEALALAIKTGNEEEKLDAMNTIGITYDIEGKRDSSRFYFNLVYEGSIETANPKRRAAALNNLGMWHWNGGLFKEAQNYYFKTIHLSDSIADSITLAKAYNNVGLIYQELNEYDKGKEYNLKALSIRSKLNNRIGIMHSCNNLGICYLRLENIDSAEFYYQKALAIAESDGIAREIAKINQNLGNIQIFRGNLRVALDYVLRSLDYKEDAIGNMISFSTLSEIYYKMGDAKKSIEAGEKALNLALQTNNSGHREDIYENLTYAHILAGHGSKAIQYLDSSFRLKKELFSKETAEIYSELEVKYETTRKEQQIALQQAELARNKAELANTRLLVAASIILFILTVLITVLLINRSRKKQKIEIQRLELEKRGAEIHAAIESEEKERKRYARDLHDGLGQMISLLRLNLSNLEKNSGGEERSKIFLQSEEVMDQMHHEIRNICFNLMPQSLISQGLPSAIREFSERINATGAKKIELHLHGMDNRLTDLQEISIYRIVQEWINNILKHSNARSITVQLTGDLEELTLVIEDNGDGFDQKEMIDSSGNGWKNILSRVKLINASLDLDTEPGRKGNTLIVNVPITEVVLTKAMAS